MVRGRLLTSRLLTAVLLSAAFVTGCGSPTPESLFRERLALMHELSDVFDTVKDVASAEAAIPRIKDIGERRKGLEKRLGQMGLSQAQNNEIAEKLRPEIQTASARLMKSRPKDAAILRNEKFSEALREVR